jgi:hypothetical protein
MVWNGFGVDHKVDVIHSDPFVDHTLRLIQHSWVVLAYNINLVILVLIIGESCIGAFLLTILLQFYTYYYLELAFYSCTY